MRESLKKYMIDQVTFPKETEIDGILELFEVVNFKKGEFFKKPFVAGPDIAFLPEGAVRIIIYKENGDEITARIRENNSFIIDPFRLKGIEVSPLGIECLADQSLLVAPISKLTKLFETNLAWNIVIRKQLMEQMADIAQSQYLFLTGNAKERYNYIIENNPGLLKKFPLHFIASMIGITPTQLSRIRNKK
ncbi:MAG: hypothetical protein AAFY71_17090 [Bacteroidota bacterium]